MNARYALLALALPALLTGCGVVAAFVPPIEVADPFGVEGQAFTVTFGEDGAALTAPAQSRAQGTFSRAFDDQSLDLRGFSLARLDVETGFDPGTSVARPLGAGFPAAFTLTRTAGTARLSDAGAEAVLRFDHAPSLTFTRDPACDLAAPVCSYRHHGDEAALASALSVSTSDRGTLRRFVAVVRLDDRNTPNTGRFGVGLEADSDPSLDGFSVTFTLRSGKATIKLGG